MGVFAAVMTGKGTGAISTIRVFGDSTEAVVKKVFKPAAGKPVVFEPGRILSGNVVDHGRTVDQVILGCEGRDNLAIHCHGNPLIVEMIMELLAGGGAQLIEPEQLMAKLLSAQKPANTIALEAKLTQSKAMTIEGARIVLNQVTEGLSKTARQWLDDLESASLEDIKQQAGRILRRSQPAKLIIFGCTAVIAGPPNSGKSTLLNYLSGKQKAIVTDISGTTRDWVGARCKIGPLSVELIDTAGLDEALDGTAGGAIEQASQQKAVELLEKADLILVVLDSSIADNRLSERLVKAIAGKRVLTVLNKSDLDRGFDARKLPQLFQRNVLISAKYGAGIDNLSKTIVHLCGAVDFDPRAAVCVTARQEELVVQLHKAESPKQAASVINELLNAPLRV